MPWWTRFRNTASGISTCRQRRFVFGRRSAERARDNNRQSKIKGTMTHTAELPLPATGTTRTKFVGVVCFAHFVSHYYIMLLPPLFAFVREDYGVSYTELGLALTAFNVISTILQTPAGFLVDRVSARMVLIVGLLLGAGAFALAGLIDSFWVFVAMFAVAGLGNTVFH